MLHLINRSGAGWLAYYQLPDEDEFEAAAELFYISDLELANISKDQISTNIRLTDSPQIAYN